MIPFDSGTPIDPSGIRLGSPAITTRGITSGETRELAKVILTILESKGSPQSLEAAKELVSRLCKLHPLPYQKP
jgi:glycine hydroxymethyltransferase